MASEGRGTKQEGDLTKRLEEVFAILEEMELQIEVIRKHLKIICGSGKDGKKVD